MHLQRGNQYLNAHAKKIITHNDPMGSTVVATGDCPKSFLPSCVPLDTKQIKIKGEKSVNTTMKFGNPHGAET